MAKYIPIDEITIDRTLVPGDDVTVLAQALNDQGQKIPILIDHENRLIDGLRRIEALRSLGITTVLAASTSMYPVACAILQQAREHGVAAAPLTPRRVWQINTALQPLMRITRAANMTGRKRGSPPQTPTGGRKALAAALGFNSGSPLQAIGFTYRSLNDPDPAKAARAQEAVRLMEAGTITYYRAADMINKEPGLTGGIKNLTEQRAALQTSVASLRGLIKGLYELGSINKKMAREELLGYLGEFIALRGDLYRFIRLLQEETNRE